MSDNKNLLIYKSRKKNLSFLLISIALSGFLVYGYLTDESLKSKGSDLFVVAGSICFLMVCFSVYEFLDKRPLYIFTDEGIHSRRGNKTYSWKEFSSFKLQENFNNIRTVTLSLYDRNEKIVRTIDLSHTDKSVDQIEKRVTRKLRKTM